MNKNLVKSIISVGAVVTLISSSFLVVSAHETSTPNEKHDHPAMVLNVNPNGKILLRGTVQSVGTNSITVKSWGGDWVVNVSTSTKLMPEGVSLSDFKVGDFVGVHGSTSTTATLTVDATLVRDWRVKEESQMMKKEIKGMMEAGTPRNRQGAASNINVPAKSFTLTMEDKTFTVNVTADAKIVNKNYITITFGDILVGDTVRVWGSLSDTTITASVVRDVSIPR